ncbi:hypothetical protein PoB_004558400 [Plakobranchus ocellatus]|uniref:Uncharacterized protein n=1 Tax=Plakobranchus ocellatus TaxID=259542 RepID=A0AAV4BL91_9GAST|nr:hypothetical protein PoB_004558400 [Plakobranchus ocellatus]
MFNANEGRLEKRQAERLTRFKIREADDGCCCISAALPRYRLLHVRRATSVSQTHGLMTQLNSACLSWFTDRQAKRDMERWDKISLAWRQESMTTTRVDS